MALRELLAVFDINVEGGEKLKTAEKGIDGLVDKFTKVGAILAGGFLGKELVEFVKGTIEASAESFEMAERLGVTTQELTKFKYAAGLSGIGAEEAAQSLNFLNKNIGDSLTKGGESAQLFQKLGVTLKDSSGQALPATEVLAQLGEGVNKLGSQGEKTAAAMTLLGRGGARLLPLFSEGGEGIRKAFEEAEELRGGLGSGGFAKAAHEAEQAMFKLKFVMNGFKGLIVAAIVPGLTKTVNKFKDWAKEAVGLVKNTNAIKVALMALTPILVGAALKGAVAIAKLFHILKPGKQSLLQTLASFGKFGLIVAVVGALFLLFEDLYTLMTGGESVIGETLDKLLGVGASAELVATLKELWQDLKQAWDESLPSLKEIGSILGEGLKTALPYIIRGFVIIVEVLAAATHLLSGFIQSILALPGAIKSGDFSGIGKIIDKAGEAAVNLFTKKGGVLQTAGPEDYAANLDRYGGASIPAAGGIGGSVKQDNKINITVNGSSNPQETASRVGSTVRDTLADQLRQAKAAVPAGG